MRKIGHFEEEELSRKFSSYLDQNKIENSIEMQLNSQSETFSYYVWVNSEDDIGMATQYLEEFKKDPHNLKFEILPKNENIKVENPSPPSSPPLKIARRKIFPFQITYFLVGLCVAIFLINLMQEVDIAKRERAPSFIFITPIQYYLLFDNPQMLIELQKVATEYKIDPQKKLEQQSAEVQAAIERVEKMPLWRGIYEIILKKWQKKPLFLDEINPLFEKIRQGEVWRLVSPCFLHKGLLHILFNMLWLWILGKQIEARLTVARYLFFIVLVGVITNVAQYLMSGPYFLGYSGIVMGKVGFIWMRQRVAPWEGYPIQKLTFWFLGFFVFAMFLLQLFSFFVALFEWSDFAPNIANTAHIVGAIVGAFLGRLSFFAWRPLEY